MAEGTSGSGRGRGPEAVAAARNSGRSFAICYAVAQAGLPVALWTGDMDEARRQADLLVAQAQAIRAGNNGGSASSVRSDCELATKVSADRVVHRGARGHAFVPPFADLAPDANIRMPLPGAEPVDFGTRRSCCASMRSCCFGTTRRVP